MKQKYYLTAGALFCSAISGLALPIASTFAEGASSLFDLNAQACIIENYNAENSTAIETIEDVNLDYKKITVLNCSDRGITNIRGITMMTNLKELDISDNRNLQTDDIDFSQNTKLEKINVSGIRGTRFDFSKNLLLESIITDRNLYLKTPAYVGVLSNDAEYDYGMDLSVLKFLNSTAAPVTNDEKYPAKYDSTTKMVSYKYGSVPAEVPVVMGDHTYFIDSRGGSVSYRVYLDDEYKETIEDEIYYGDTIKVNEELAVSLLEGDEAEEYTLSKITVGRKNNFEFTTNEDTVKEGKALADAELVLGFYFDSDKPSVPDTGAFTADGKNLVAITSIVSIAVTGIVLYLAHYIVERQKTKVRFDKN